MEKKKDIKGLIGVLGDSNWSTSERKRAAEALGKIRDARAVEPLLAEMKQRKERIEMKKFVTLFVFVGALLAGFSSHQSQSVPASENLQATAPVTSTRDMVLLYEGAQNPGAGWERISKYRGFEGWERRLSVSLRLSSAEGKKEYSLLLSELGTLPVGKVWIGPVHGGSGIEKGATIANFNGSNDHVADRSRKGSVAMVGALIAIWNCANNRVEATRTSREPYPER